MTTEERLDKIERILKRVVKFLKANQKGIEIIQKIVNNNEGNIDWASKLGCEANNYNKIEDLEVN
ncbi:MAG TPA: hypothetical protein ENN45_04305 [Bacteroidetes bacterium]|nr:hypothetical protein [Bacteroidota bacterium]